MISPSLPQSPKREDLLAGPLPWRRDEKSFQQISLTEQNVIIFRMIEATLMEVQAVRAHLKISDEDVV